MEAENTLSPIIMEVGNGAPEDDFSLLLGAIFHFHDYGRKGKPLPKQYRKLSSSFNFRFHCFNCCEVFFSTGFWPRAMKRAGVFFGKNVPTLNRELQISMHVYIGAIYLKHILVPLKSSNHSVESYCASSSHILQIIQIFRGFLFTSHEIRRLRPPRGLCWWDRLRREPG